jgi:O-antigen/teichoic acid export membrane protein
MNAKDRIIQNLFFKDKNFKDLIAGSTIVFAGKLLSALLVLFFNYLVTNYYGAEGMGLMALVNSFLAIALVPALLGFQTSLLRLIPEYTGRYSSSAALRVYRKSFLMMLAGSVVVALFAYLSSDFIAIYVFKKPEVSFLLCLAALFLVFNAITSFNQSAIRAFKNVRYFSLISVLRPVINILLLMTLLYCMSSIYSPVYAVLGSSFVLSFLSFLFFRRVMPSKSINATYDDAYVSISKIFKISIPMLFTSVIMIVIAQTDIIMLGMYSSVSSVGIYAIVVKLALLTSFIIGSINTVVAPSFSEFYYSKNIEKLKQIVDSSTRLVFGATMLLCLFLVVFGKLILGLFGEEFIIGYWALYLLMFGRFVAASCGSVGYLMNMIGYQKIVSFVLFAGGLINIFLNYIFIPQYGINGAAFASMFAVIFLNITNTLIVLKKEGINTSFFGQLKRNDC